MTVQIDLISGFLGAGKTTLINKILPVRSSQGKLALIENEYGSISIDGSLVPGNLPMREIYAGCICCTMAVDFINTIQEIVETLQPERILIEPTGIGQLSDVVKACTQAQTQPPVAIHTLTTLVDISQFSDYAEDFGSFYTNQIANAGLILLSHFQDIKPAERNRAVAAIRRLNPKAVVLEEDWQQLPAATLCDILDDPANSQAYLQRQIAPQPAGGPHDESCTCGCHTHQHEPKHGYNHEHSRQAEGSLKFVAWGKKQLPCYTPQQLERTLAKLKDTRLGKIARGKGLVQQPDGSWLRFDFTPKHQSWQPYVPDAAFDGVSKVTMIGLELNVPLLENLFN